MPLNAKGKKIMAAMRKQYGAKAKEVFYASENKGTISGVKKKKGDYTIMERKGLYYNINKRKEAGTSRSKKDSTISPEAYRNMKAGFPKKKKKTIL
jgi:hypothetical protein